MDFNPKDYPCRPGVYLYKDDKGRIIYVGKAKDLRKRLSSYFRKGARHTPKTRALLARAASLDILLAPSEKEALLLEESLIKKHRPRYNIVLKDDKRYVLFKLSKNEDYPRLTMTRKVRRDGAVYYGPFTSALDARKTWKALVQVFPLRKCSSHVFANRSRPCLYFQLGQCLGPCVNRVDRDLYRGWVRQIELVLTGRAGELLKSLTRDMKRASDDLAFEEAARIRDRIKAIRNTVARQVAVLSSRTRNCDYLALSAVEGAVGLGAVFVRSGLVLDQKNWVWPGLTMDESMEILSSFMVQYYSSTKLIPDAVVLPIGEPDPVLADLISERAGHRVAIRPARDADEKRLVHMAREVAARAGMSVKEDLSETLARKLGLGSPVSRIECVDASHHGGENLRVGKVVFEEGRPETSSYRAYAMSELEGSHDDYAALANFARRRITSGPPWPDLLLVDGGKGQLSAVMKGLDQERGQGLFAVAAIAKGPSRRAGELEDRVFLPGRKNPLALKPGSPELLFLQRVRDEAHRYTVGRQNRAKRKKALESELLSLPGIGPKTARLLWDAFHSLDRMARAGYDEIAAIEGIGPKRAKSIHASLAGLGGK